jgi:hypothetical protein
MNINKKKIDYIEIFKKSFSITLKNKFLWWFGLFVAIAGGGNSFNYSANNDFGNENSEALAENISYYWSLYSEWIILGIVIILILFLSFVLLGFLGRGALIGSLVKIEKGEEMNFTKGLRQGRKFFWRVLLLEVFASLVMLFLGLILFIPVIRLVVLEAYVPAFILGAIAVIIFLSVILLVSFMRVYSRIYMIEGNLKVMESIKLAYNLFKINVKESILMAIFLIAIWIIASISLLFFIALASIPFVIGGLILSAAMGPLFVITLGFLATATVVAAGIFWGAIYAVFSQGSWVLFFNKIAKNKFRNNESEVKEELYYKKVAEQKSLSKRKAG